MRCRVDYMWTRCWRPFLRFVDAAVASYGLASAKALQPQCPVLAVPSSLRRKLRSSITPKPATFADCTPRCSNRSCRCEEILQGKSRNKKASLMWYAVPKALGDRVAKSLRSRSSHHGKHQCSRNQNMVGRTRLSQF